MGEGVRACAWRELACAIVHLLLGRPALACLHGNPIAHLELACKRVAVRLRALALVRDARGVGALDGVLGPLRLWPRAALAQQLGRQASTWTTLTHAGVAPMAGAARAHDAGSNGPERERLLLAYNCGVRGLDRRPLNHVGCIRCEDDHLVDDVVDMLGFVLRCAEVGLGELCSLAVVAHLAGVRALTLLGSDQRRANLSTRKNRGIDRWPEATDLMSKHETM